MRRVVETPQTNLRVAVPIPMMVELERCQKRQSLYLTLRPPDISMVKQ